MGDLTPIKPGQPQEILRQVSKALTKSDREFIEDYSNTNNLTEAGYAWSARRGKTLANEIVACAIASRKLIEVRKKVEAIGGPELFWEMLKLGANKIAKRLEENMNAVMVKPMVIREQVVVKMRRADGTEYDRVLNQERIVEMGPYADGPTRNEAIRLAALLRGDIKRGQGGAAVADEDREAPVYIFNIGDNAQVQVNQK